MTLKLFVLIQSRHMPYYIILGSMVTELHDMRLVCLLKAVTPAWVTITASFLFLFDYIDHSGSFDVLQAKVKSFIGRVRAAGPACLKLT